MTLEAVTKQFWQAPQVKRRCAILLFVAAVLCVITVPGAGRVTLPIAFVLVGLLLWTRSRPFALDMDQEITDSLHQWMANTEDDPEMKVLRQAFQDYFAGVRLLAEHANEDGARKLRLALASFDTYLSKEGVKENHHSGGHGLQSSAYFHRAKSAFHLATLVTDMSAQLRQFRAILHDLAGFEQENKGWPMLIMPALALRIELHLRLGEIDDAEADQEVLDRHSVGQNPKPEIEATRRVLADAMWEAAAGHANEEIASGLRFRALIHYDEWLERVGSDYLGAKLIVAKRNSELEQGTHVIALLADVIDDHRFAESVGRRGLLDANRLLARAYLHNQDYGRALSYYSVLMSVGGDSNPYLRDADVLREIDVAETKQAQKES